MYSGAVRVDSSWVCSQWLTVHRGTVSASQCHTVKYEEIVDNFPEQTDTSSDKKQLEQ